MKFYDDIQAKRIAGFKRIAGMGYELAEYVWVRVCRIKGFNFEVRTNDNRQLLLFSIILSKDSSSRLPIFPRQTVQACASPLGST
jgi:hypothetical protein